MLKVTLFELIFRLIPEGFLFCLFMFILVDKKIVWHKFVLTSIIFGLTPYFIRFLPINFGVHTILSLIVYFAVAVIINKIEPLKAISSGLLSVVILSICEFINFFIVINIFKYPVERLLDNVRLKMLFGSPSLLLFALILFIIYKVKRKNIKEVSKVV